jgi:hypothetical protein
MMSSCDDKIAFGFGIVDLRASAFSPHQATRRVPLCAMTAINFEIDICAAQQLAVRNRAVSFSSRVGEQSQRCDAGSIKGSFTFTI